MKNYIDEGDRKNFIFNNMSISHFAKLKKLSKNDQEGIRVAYRYYTMWLCAILAFLISLTMIFDYFYGFYSNYFFNDAGFGIYKFIGVTLDFVFGCSYIIYFLSAILKIQKQLHLSRWPLFGSLF